MIRREFVSIVARGGAMCALTACRDDGGSIAGLPDPEHGVVVDGDLVTITLAAQPALARAGGHLVSLRASVIVLHPTANQFRAFTSVCTHAGCGITRIDNGEMVCPCHGSRFDSYGRNVAGPAPGPLAEYPAAFDPAARVIRVTRRAVTQ